MLVKTIFLILGAFLFIWSTPLVRANIVTDLIESKLYPAAFVDLPFQAGVKGAVLQTQFRALTKKGYTFYLDLHFREGDSRDKERVRKLAGTGVYNKSGRQIDTGPPIPVRLRVERVGAIGSSAFVIDGTFTNHDLEGTSADYFSKIISGAIFEPGVYQVRIEALEDVPELVGIHVRFNMHARSILQ